MDVATTLCFCTSAVANADVMTVFVDATGTVVAWLDALHEIDGVALLAAMTGLLLLGTLGFPFPEEAVMATGGAMAAAGRVELFWAYLVGWGSVLALDLGLFWVGRRLGHGRAIAKASSLLGEARARRMERLILRRGAYVAGGARFVMGMRIPVFLIAGAAGLPWRRFAPAVAICGLVSAAIPTLLGYHLAAELPALLETLRRASGLILAVVVGVLAVATVWWVWRRRRRRAVPQEATAEQDHA